MKFYNTTRAPNPDRVRYFLQAKGKFADVENIEIALLEGEHRAPDYRVLSPLAKVPALELDDGSVLLESRAICTYLDDLYREPNLMGRDGRERAEIEMWDRQIEFNFLLGFANWFRHAHPALAALEATQFPDFAEANKKTVKRFTEYLDVHLSKNEYVAAGRFTIADITTYVCCNFAGTMKWSPQSDHAAIGEWYARMKEKDFAVETKPPLKL